MPHRPVVAPGAAPAFAHALTEDADAGGDPRSRSTGKAERDANRKRDEHPGRAVRPTGSDKPDGKHCGARPDRARDETEGRALDRRKKEQASPGRPTGSQQGEVASVALGCAERGEVRERQRDQRTGHGEHDVQRFCVERIADRRVETVGKVVDELGPAR